MIYLWYILVALIPGLFWLWFYRRRDLKNPEPLKMIFKIFVWGMAATIPAIALEFAVEFFIPYASSTSYLAMVLSSFLVVAPIEEFFKYLVLKHKAAKSPEFNEPIDGIIYGIVVGLGFATLENFLVTLSDGGTVIILRFATATLMHAICSGIVGYYIARQKFHPQGNGKSVLYGLLLAIFLHGLYNSVASYNSSISLILLTILIIVMYLMLSQDIRKIKQLKITTQQNNQN